MNSIRRTFKSLTASRGLTKQAVALAAGMSEGALDEAITGNSFFHRRARKIELVLGAPLWMSIQEWERLQQAAQCLSTDPVLTGFQELRRRAIALKVPNARYLTNKQDLIAAVLALPTPMSHEKENH